MLARFSNDATQPASWSASGLYKAIKAFLATATKGLDEAGAGQLRNASSHWLRHAHASHALQGKGGKSGVPLQVVQNNLGHVSIGTTSMYLTTERYEKVKAMRGF